MYRINSQMCPKQECNICSKLNNLCPYQKKYHGNVLFQLIRLLVPDFRLPFLSITSKKEIFSTNLLPVQDTKFPQKVFARAYDPKSIRVTIKFANLLTFQKFSKIHINEIYEQKADKWYF